MAQLISLTQSAAEQVNALIAQAPEGRQVIGLRIGVQSVGCHGIIYRMEYATEKTPAEGVVEDRGVSLFIDPWEMPYLIGTEMDYREGWFESGFTFKNPNETGPYKCGKLFNPRRSRGL